MSEKHLRAAHQIALDCVELARSAAESHFPAQVQKSLENTARVQVASFDQMLRDEFEFERKWSPDEPSQSVQIVNGEFQE